MNKENILEGIKMLKKIGILMVGIMWATNVMAKDIVLPEPEKAGTMSLMEALQNRHSDHQFAKKDLSNQDLSNILWVAYGVSRSDRKRTIPTARNEKDLNIYVFNKKGIFLYQAEENKLKEISNKNALGLFQKQDYMDNVPAVLVYTGKEDYAQMHAGSAYQNVGLYTATNKLASIVRGMFDEKAVAKILPLAEGEKVIISQAIGWEE